MTKTVKMRYCPDFDVTTTVTLEGKRVVELRGVAERPRRRLHAPYEAEALATWSVHRADLGGCLCRVNPPRR
jgi:hypothetical protein